MEKKLLLLHLKEFFKETQESAFWKKLRLLSPVYRFILAIPIILFGLLGVLTPIPAGIVFLIFGFSLIVGLQRVRGWVLALVHFLRINVIYAKIYTYWHERKRKGTIL